MALSKKKNNESKNMHFSREDQKKFFPPLPRLLLKRLTVQFVRTSFSRKRAMNALYSS